MQNAVKFYAILTVINPCNFYNYSYGVEHGLSDHSLTTDSLTDKMGQPTASARSLHF